MKKIVICSYSYLKVDSWEISVNAIKQSKWNKADTTHLNRNQSQAFPQTNASQCQNTKTKNTNSGKASQKTFLNTILVQFVNTFVTLIHYDVVENEMEQKRN